MRCWHLPIPSCEQAKSLAFPRLRQGEPPSTYYFLVTSIKQRRAEQRAEFRARAAERPWRTLVGIWSGIVLLACAVFFGFFMFLAGTLFPDVFVDNDTTPTIGKVVFLVVMLSLVLVGAVAILALVNLAVEAYSPHWIIGPALLTCGLLAFGVSLAIRVNGGVSDAASEPVSDWFLTVVESVGSAFLIGSVVDLIYLVANREPVRAKT